MTTRHAIFLWSLASPMLSERPVRRLYLLLSEGAGSLCRRARSGPDGSASHGSSHGAGSCSSTSGDGACAAGELRARDNLSHAV